MAFVHYFYSYFTTRPADATKLSFSRERRKREVVLCDGRTPVLPLAPLFFFLILLLLLFLPLLLLRLLCSSSSVSEVVEIEAPTPPVSALPLSDLSQAAKRLVEPPNASNFFQSLMFLIVSSAVANSCRLRCLRELQQVHRVTEGSANGGYQLQRFHFITISTATTGHDASAAAAR